MGRDCFLYLRVMFVPGSLNLGHAGVQGGDPTSDGDRTDLNLLWMSVSGSVSVEEERAVCELLLPVWRGCAP